MTASTILYILWYFWGALYFTMGFWALLEKAGKSHKTQDPNEMFKQGVFLTLVAGASTLVDIYCIDGIANLTTIDPLVYRLALFPALLAVGAMMTGPSNPIKIKASKNKHKKR